MASTSITIQNRHCCDLSFRGNAAANPFKAGLKATFTGPEHQQLAIPGFYNGNGEWLVRFSPTSEGDWSYLTSSDLPELDARDGTVQCTKNQNPNIHGRLIINRTNPRHFQHEDGTAYFLVAHELDWLFALDLDNSTDIPKTRMLIDTVAGNGFNHVIMNVYAHETPWEEEGSGTEHDYGAPALFPFGGTNDKPDHSTLNIEFFKRFDRVIAYLHKKGVIAHLMLYVWNKKVNWPEKGSEADNQYLDYVVARYQAYSNIVWDISKEALSYDYAGEDYIRNRAMRVRARDAYKQLITVHDSGYCRKHTDTIDFFSIQSWQSSLYAAMREIRERYPDMPVLNIEHGGYEEGPYQTFTGDYSDPIVCLARNYECIFAGTYSTYYWQCAAWDIVIHNIVSLPPGQRPHLEFFRYMQAFFSEVDYPSLQPTQDYATSGFCLFRENQLYLFYKPEGTRCIHLCLPGQITRCQTSWFSPVTGERTDVEPHECHAFSSCHGPWDEGAAVLKVEVLAIKR
jgi:hypothetical protein